MFDVLGKQESKGEKDFNLLCYSKRGTCESGDLTHLLQEPIVRKMVVYEKLFTTTKIDRVPKVPIVPEAEQDTIEKTIKAVIRAFRVYFKKQFSDIHYRKQYGWVDATYIINLRKYF